MKNNFDDRILEIKLERYSLLYEVRENIKGNNEFVNDNADKLLDVLNKDEISVKKYEALVNAKKMISNLAEEIAKAESVEEITNLRKKLNYCISKIKNELTKRNIDSNELDEFKNSVSYLRKDIAKLIRGLKREDNLTGIDDLIKNVKDLSKDEIKELRKMIRLEKDFNKRNANMDKYQNKNSKSLEEMISKIEFNDPVETTIKSFEYSFPMESDYLIDMIDTNLYGTVEDSLNDSIFENNNRYGVIDTEEYNSNNSLGNINIFFKNVPKYFKNRKIVKKMKADSQVFYGGADFVSYIEYLKRKNSINHGLKSIFSRTYLNSKEGKYLNEHEKCASWIIDFCNKNNMDVNRLRKARSL